MADTPKAVVVADSHKKFELHHALKGGSFFAFSGDVLSDIGAHKITHCK
jgi:ABC-type histidine transport system ATPase subunit